MCGEKFFQKILCPLYIGSPPRVRGKAPMSRVKDVYEEDHPRVCGEKGSSLHTTSVSPGSPPRVRGKEKKGFGGFVNTRITPACAGKSRSRKSKGIISKDHPRVCGEKRITLAPGVRFPGSPPRVRGKARFCFPCSNTTRITPACAGKREIAYIGVGRS